MSFWLIDRTLPGIIGGLVVSLAIGIEHFFMRRHLTRLTREQTAELKPSASDAAQD